ncbi:MAG: hypothetical protein JNK66_04935 [Chitinophagales bacterium]|nr:hypothetical protein [Chitinophagales bacterium]
MKPIFQIFITALLLSTAILANAQPGGGGGGQGNGGPPPGGAVPIDGGVILLAAGAALYGRKVMRSTNSELV